MRYRWTLSVGDAVGFLFSHSAEAGLVSVSASDFLPGSDVENALPSVKIQTHRYAYSQPPAPVPPNIAEIRLGASDGEIPESDGPRIGFGDAMLTATLVAPFTDDFAPRYFSYSAFWLEFATPTDLVAVTSIGKNPIAESGGQDPAMYSVRLFGYDINHSLFADTGWVPGGGFVLPVTLQIESASTNLKYAELQFSFGSYNQGYVTDFSFSAVPEVSPFAILAATGTFSVCSVLRRRQR